MSIIHVSEQYHPTLHSDRYRNILFRLCLFTHIADDRKIFCYYSTSVQNRLGLGKFLPENIDPDLCTHVIFAFAKVMETGSIEPGNWNDLPSGDEEGECLEFVANEE